MRRFLLACAVTAGLGLANAQAPARYETIPQLGARTFGQGSLSFVRVLERTPAFTRHLVRYDSDGLKVEGFVNVPSGRGPFPVVMVLHGYVEPSRYRTLSYTTRYADDLARAGFVAFHPNYRGHGGSQGAPEGVWRFGYARDVLNLVALVRRDAGRAGPLATADGQRIGLWGHSMGGGIALRVAVADPAVRAVVLYGAMSGDEARNADRIYRVYSGGARGRAEAEAPRAVVDAISPIRFLNRSGAAFSVHHGTADADVPHAWSVEACTALKAAGRPTECFSYANAPHLFRGATDATFRTRVQTFLRRELGRSR